MRIAFDVDGTLFDEKDRPRRDVLSILRTLSEKHTIIIWSGGGIDYAKRKVNNLDIEHRISFFLPKQAGQSIDLCFDDQEVKLATINVVV